jgi:hypothetical protein
MRRYIQSEQSPKYLWPRCEIHVAIKGRQEFHQTLQRIASESATEEPRHVGAFHAEKAAYHRIR